jgi:hypothetical protein
MPRGINPDLLFSTTQIEARFRDDLGNSRSILGTGFFLKTRGATDLFITNRHNLDPSLSKSLRDSHRLESARLRLRRHAGLHWQRETQWAELDLRGSRILHSGTADVSAIANLTFVERPTDFTYFPIRTSDLANQALFSAKVFVMDLVSFIGFPGDVDSYWWDTEWNLPIARLASLSSRPHVPFNNPSISTADTTLVAGLSFSGSSGSMVLLHEKGIPPGDIVDPMYTPATIIGIMSGHWWEPGQEPSMFRHSGLSYYTRSTSILDLIAAIP